MEYHSSTAIHQLFSHIRDLQKSHQMQKLMTMTIAELHVGDANKIQHVLCAMVTAAIQQQLLSTESLRRLVSNSLPETTVPTNSNSNSNSSTVTSSIPQPLVTFTKSTKLHRSLSRSISSPLLSIAPTTSLKKRDFCTVITPLTNLLDLPDHILSYCCSYLATRDLLLSVDLCNLRMCSIARMSSSFHGKFICGSAIHCEYHKLVTHNHNENALDRDRQNQEIAAKMLHRFRHSKEIHFINIFNHDTIQLLKSTDFSKMESIYLYDRFNRLVEHLPLLIPNVANLYVTTKGGNETLEMIQANVEYYSQPLTRMFEGYAHSIKTVDLRHSTFYEIPLMLPERVTQFLLHGTHCLDALSLQNVYFPPDFDVEDTVSTALEMYNYGEDQDTIDIHTNHHRAIDLKLEPYNEYCASHFHRGLRSLSMHWNVVGENHTLNMGTLRELKTLTLSLKTDNDSLDTDGLRDLLTQSECLDHIDSLNLTLDLENAVWSATEKVWEILNYILAQMGANHRWKNGKIDPWNETLIASNIKIEVVGVCRCNLYSNVLRTMMIQLLHQAVLCVNNSNNTSYSTIEVVLQHPMTDADLSQIHQQSMVNWIHQLQSECSSMLQRQSVSNSNNMQFSLSMTDEVSRMHIVGGHFKELKGICKEA